MSYRPGDTFYLSFSTQTAAGAAIDADALPAAALRRNGANDSAVVVAVAHNATGDYTASAAIPLTYSGGDELEIVVNTTIATVNALAIHRLGKLDRTAQAVAQVVYRSSLVHFVTAAGNASNDGLGPETAQALPTDSTPGPGETILVFSGTYPVDTNVLDLSGDGTTGVHLTGAGMGATVMTSNVLLISQGCIVKPGNGSQISDLTIQGIASSVDTPNQYQAPIGASARQTPFAGAVARRIHLVGDSDGVYISSGTNSVSFSLYDCIADAMYDCFNIVSGVGNQVDLHNCHFNAVGPSNCNSGKVTRGLAASAGTIFVYGGTLNASDANTQTYGAQSQGVARINLYDVEIGSASSAGSVMDLVFSGSGALSAFNCTYVPAKTQGTIFAENILPTLAAVQNFNNSGQTTPMPGTTALVGPNSVTLVFHDAAGNPVPGVVFTVEGLGSAVADSGGSRTISLPSGTFTIQSLPTAGTLWPETPITVSGSATFTLTGTAITIPAATDPAQTTAYLTTRDGRGNPVGSVTLSFQLVNPQLATDSYDQTIFTAESNSSGLLQVPLLKSTQYQSRVGSGAWVPFTTGAGSTYALPEVLGAYGC